ncbi:HEPN domain-containing protein [Candidatus Pacearchaeota archaeon]|nr:HEPN domain-containing protein [Candidatus Pacearchaeota archaeon]
MDSQVEIFVKRANNELLAAEALRKLSEEIKYKGEFSIPQNETFYSSVISHSYYAIFYAAKAILLTKNIRTTSPNIHRTTYDLFDKTFVKTGVLDKKLLQIYTDIVVKAGDLLEIFKDEKWKRGNFTYQVIAQANKTPADDSLKNAKLFVANISKVIGD